MALFTLINRPAAALPLLSFYRALLDVPPQTLGLTLAGIALGLLLLRRLDGRPAPLLFRAAAVSTAALSLAALTGLVGAYGPLAAATGGVLLLLLDEAVHLLATTFGRVGYAATELVSDGRRLLSTVKARESRTPETAPNERD